MDLSQIPTEQLVAMLHGSQNPAAKMPDMNPTEGMSGTQKFLAGTGKAFADVGRGVGQLTGFLDRKDIDESKRHDAALMGTGAGIAGNIVGNAALFAPTAAIPGANTYTGAALTGAAMGALQPVGEKDSRGLNTAVGGAAGVAGQALGRGIGRLISPVSSRLSPEAEQLAQAAQREGIPLTAGQRTGSKPLQIAESVMENLPLTSGPQIAQRDAQQRAFTAAALKRAGMQGDTAGAGELLTQKKALGQALGGVAKNNSLDFMQGLDSRLTAISDDAAKHLPPDLAGKVAHTVEQVKNQTLHGVMEGTNYQGWREPLRGLASNTETGNYYKQIRGAMDQAFRSQLPGAQGDAYRETSRQYANLKTIIDAMGGPGALPAEGQIAPAQLSAALGRSMGREGRALGQGDLNELTKIGQKFVKGQIPDSGTAQRHFITSLLTGGVGAGTGAGAAAATGHDPWKGAAYGAMTTGAGLAAPRVAQMLMNSGAGQAYLTNQVLTPELRTALAAAMRTGTLGAVPALESR